MLSSISESSWNGTQVELLLLHILWVAISWLQVSGQVVHMYLSSLLADFTYGDTDKGHRWRTHRIQ